MILLASGSPRRRELLALLRVPFEVAPADAATTIAIVPPPPGKPTGNVKALKRDCSLDFTAAALWIKLLIQGALSHWPRIGDF